jgi:hypothetical protein
MGKESKYRGTVKEYKYRVTVREGAYDIAESWEDECRWPDRKHGPAVIHRDPKTGVVTNEIWMRKNKYHRDDGPAMIWRDATTGQITRVEYYTNGRRTKPAAAPSRPAVRELRARQPTGPAQR